MKKLLVAGLLSFSCVSLFAVECTDKQNEKYFSNSRYFNHVDTFNGKVVLDKDSIKFDKQKQIAKVWIINQLKTDPQGGFFKTHWEHDMKNNRVRLIGAGKYFCNGYIIFSENANEGWQDIIPESVNEFTHKALNVYLDINQLR